MKASKAEEIIRESSCKDKTKERMCRIIRDTAKNGLQKASLNYEKKHKNFCDMMGRFNSLGISPITIKQRSKIECMDHPIECIKSRNANLPKQQVFFWTMSDLLWNSRVHEVSAYSLCN